MKVVVTALGQDLDSEVDPRFGRAHWMILADTGSDAVEVLDNRDQASAGQGAGVQAAQLVIAAGAEALLTGHCGPKAFQVLEAGGVAVYSGVTGTVREALRKLRDGELEPSGGPDTAGHW